MENLNHSKCVFQGVRFDVNQIETTTRHGKSVLREAVVHPGAVVILPILSWDKIILIQNFRFAVGEVLWELPAGTLEPNEEPHQTAARELIEETGYSADEVEFLTKFFTSPGICTEVMHAYVAKNLRFIGQKLDETEEISVFTFDWPSVLKMIKDGQIKDGKTIATLLFYHQIHQESQGH